MRAPAAFLACLLSLAFVTVAHAAPEVRVQRKLIKIGIEKVLRVQLAAQQPADPKKRTVEIRMAATYDKCAQGEAFSFLEGTWEKVDYFSYWAAEGNPCPAKTPVDLIHVKTVDVGKNQAFVFRGPKRFDQRVTFKVDGNKINKLLIKKIIQQ